MIRFITLLVALVTLSVSAVTQTPTPAATSNSPVAYVYASRPTHMDIFAVAADGRLTQISGSPFSINGLYHMSVNSKYLFGDSDKIYTFSVSSGGAVKQIGAADSARYKPSGNDCQNPGLTQIDHTGSTLYNTMWYGCNGSDTYIQSFKIESNGDLQFLGNTAGVTNTNLNLSQLRFGSTNKFAYQTGCFHNNAPNMGQGPVSPKTVGYKRESNGALVLANTQFNVPAAQESDDILCPNSAFATDSTNHFAFALQALVKDTGVVDGPVVIASYTADANGNLTTKNTIKEMPTIALPLVTTMSIDPTGKILAVGANNIGCGGSCGPAGSQLYHFNGSGPVTLFSEELTGDNVLEFGWDADHHLFVLGYEALHVYTVTPTSYKEAPGSPYQVGAYSLIVRSTD